MGCIVRMAIAYRRGEIERRQGIGSDMFEAVPRMVLASLPADLPADERRRRLFERTYGEPLPGTERTPDEPRVIRGAKPEASAGQGPHGWARRLSGAGS